MNGQTVFRMNISILVDGTHGPLALYVEVAIALALSTVWVVTAFHNEIYPDETPLWVRFGWPAKLSMNLLKNRFGKIEKQLPIKTGIKDGSHR